MIREEVKSLPRIGEQKKIIELAKKTSQGRYREPQKKSRLEPKGGSAFEEYLRQTRQRGRAYFRNKERQRERGEISDETASERLARFAKERPRDERGKWRADTLAEREARFAREQNRLISRSRSRRQEKEIHPHTQPSEYERYLKRKKQRQQSPSYIRRQAQLEEARGYESVSERLARLAKERPRDDRGKWIEMPKRVQRLMK